jgi:hypothetical protein
VASSIIYSLQFALHIDAVLLTGMIYVKDGLKEAACFSATKHKRKPELHYYHHNGGSTLNAVFKESSKHIVNA